MRKNRHTGNGAVIDLTSLLDVIFIILLAVMVSSNVDNTSKSDELEQNMKEVKHQQDELNNKISQYDNIMQVKDNIDQWVWIVSISVPYEDDVHKRTISVMSEDQQIYSYELIGNKTEETFDKFKADLVSQIEGKDCPVILALNPDRAEILYRDEQKVSDILFELSEEYQNVSIKGNLGDT